LLSGVVLIGLFIFVIAHTLQRQSDTFSQLSIFIDQHDIETGAFVYTDMELTAQAAIGARSTIEFPPVGPQQQ
jgi:hypothetical protein